MNLCKLCGALVVMCAIVIGCAFAEEEDPTLTTSAMRGGCHTVCPPCPPHQVCPMGPCVLECNGHGDRCGNHFCPQGEACCNESCGICTEPFGFCTQEYCAPIRGQECRTDADCRLFSDYCTGCDCRALALREPGPVCDGPGVRCLVDPCMGHAAVCDVPSGKCIVQ